MPRIPYDPVALGLEVIRPLSANEFSVRCPYHNDTHPSAEFNVAKGLFYCFGCHTGKTAEQVCKDLGGVLVPMSMAEQTRLASWAQTKEWKDLVYKNPPANWNNFYLQERGLKRPSAVTYFGMRESADGIIFPIHDKFGELTGLQIRRYDGKPKYMIYGNRQPLWPMDKLTDQSKGGKLFVVEGVFGVLRGDEADLPVYAIMGSGNVDDAIPVLKSMERHYDVYVIMDPDYAGYLAAGKFAIHGFNVMVGHKKAPDDWAVKSWEIMSHHAPAGYTRDPISVVDQIPEGFKRMRIEQQLDKYWRKVYG